MALAHPAIGVAGLAVAAVAVGLSFKGGRLRGTS